MGIVPVPQLDGAFQGFQRAMTKLPFAKGVVHDE